MKLISNNPIFKLRNHIILLIKTTAAQNKIALSYHRVRGLYSLAAVFATTIYSLLLLP